MGVSGVSRDITHDAELAPGRLERVDVDEMGDLGGQVDAVDEDVALGDLLEGPALGRFRHIPLEDLLRGQARLKAQVHGAATAAAQRADDDDARQAAGLLLARRQVLLDVRDQRVLVRVALDAGERLPARVRQLPRPVLERERAAAESRLVPEGRDSPPRRGVLEELEVEERAAATREAGQDGVPTRLLLIAMRELHMYVLKGDCVGRLHISY